VTDDVRQEIHKFLAWALQGQADAMALFFAWFEVCHFWDDLIDRDKPLQDAAIDQAMTVALIEMPRNPFYRQHFADLQPVMAQAVLDWRAATQMERAPAADSDLDIAYILRCSYIAVITACAALIGGMGWAAEVNVAARRMAHLETRNDYRAALAAEQRAREVA